MSSSKLFMGLWSLVLIMTSSCIAPKANLASQKDAAAIGSDTSQDSGRKQETLAHADCEYNGQTIKHKSSKAFYFYASDATATKTCTQLRKVFNATCADGKLTWSPALSNLYPQLTCQAYAKNSSCIPRNDLSNTSCTKDSNPVPKYTVNKGTTTNNCTTVQVFHKCLDDGCGSKYLATTWINAATQKEQTVYEDCIDLGSTSKSCVYNGQTIAHNKSATFNFYKSDATSTQTCDQLKTVKTAKCNNGNLTWDVKPGTAPYTKTSCTAYTYRSCEYNNQAIKHNSSASFKFYSGDASPTKSCAQLETTKTVTCKDGTLSWDVKPETSPYTKTSCKAYTPPVEDNDKTCHPRDDLSTTACTKNSKTEEKFAKGIVGNKETCPSVKVYHECLDNGCGKKYLAKFWTNASTKLPQRVFDECEQVTGNSCNFNHTFFLGQQEFTFYKSDATSTKSCDDLKQIKTATCLNGDIVWDIDPQNEYKQLDCSIFPVVTDGDLAKTTIPCTSGGGICRDGKWILTKESCEKNETNRRVYLTALATPEQDCTSVFVHRYCFPNSKGKMFYTNWVDSNKQAVRMFDSCKARRTFSNCKYKYAGLAHGATGQEITFYRSERGTNSQPCAQQKVTKKATCYDGELRWPSTDSNGKDITAYQSLTCTNPNNQTYVGGCQDDDGNLYAVGQGIKTINLFRSPFCSYYQDCRGYATTSCNEKGKVVIDYLSELSGILNPVKERVLLPDNILTLENFGSNDIYYLGACGKHLYAVSKNREAWKNKTYEFETLHKIGQGEDSDKVSYLTQSTILYARSTSFAHFDNLTCIDQRYLAGVKQETTNEIVAISRFTPFLVDLDRLGEQHSVMTSNIAAPGISKEQRSIEYLPAFRDQDPFVPSKDIKPDSVKYLHVDQYIVLMFFGIDTTILLEIPLLNEDGAGRADALSSYRVKVDSNYQEGDRYYNTTVYSYKDRSGRFFVAKRKLGRKDPILLSCEMPNFKVTCANVVTKGITASNDNIDFSLVPIDQEPYLMAWNQSTGVVEKVWRFELDDNNTLVGSENLLSATQMAAIKNLGKAINARLPAEDKLVYAYNDKVYQVSFDDQDKLVAKTLTADAMNKDPVLVNYAYLADFIGTAKTIKNKVGDTTPVIAAKTTWPEYYLVLKSKGTVHGIVRGFPGDLKKLAEMDLQTKSSKRLKN